jgi:hypothetical protein
MNKSYQLGLYDFADIPISQFIKYYTGINLSYAGNSTPNYNNSSINRLQAMTTLPISFG